MSYTNVGAYVNGERPKTKAALKRALAEAPESVDFDTTAFNAQFSRISAEQVRTMPSAGAYLPLQVTGPDPYVTRSWYATVKLATSGRNAGKVVVS